MPFKILLFSHRLDLPSHIDGLKDNDILLIGFTVLDDLVIFRADVWRELCVRRKEDSLEEKERKQFLLNFITRTREAILINLTLYLKDTEEKNFKGDKELFLHEFQDFLLVSSRNKQDKLFENAATYTYGHLKKFNRIG